MGKPLSEQERHDRIRLARSENVGPVTFRDLLAEFGSAGAALNALPERVRQAGGKRPIRIASTNQVDKELKETGKHDVRIITVGEPDYPALLLQADPPPPLILVKGALHLASKDCIALVGSRSASGAGLRMAGDLSRALGEQGYVTVSGLARGIDATIHQKSLQTGTIAVVAGGIDVVYPEENRKLCEAIIEQGLIVSEMPMGTKPQGRHFPRRNRIISGLSRATIVVEAALRSGSLITARYALEQNRELMAVPGSPLDPRARGSNALLKQGAVLVETAEDVTNWLNQMPPPQFDEGADKMFSDAPRQPPELRDSDLNTLINLLGPTPLGEDDLIRLSGLPTQLVKAHLSSLELAGRIIREPGQRIAMIEEEWSVYEETGG
ncbi:MAG: DNA-processing protein DprA [Parvibaculum sp.]